ncbi:MAG: Pr6Pr family membrane protein [Chitinophagaceae bacterium]|nr:Pr6Pr family membrane protein [Chitinophagaceae bacterium]
MEKQASKSMKIYLAVLVILGWFALILQFYINITSKAAAIPEIIVRYFSYFTLTTNLIVATCCTTLLFKPNSRWGNFFSQQKTLTAITVYIIIVGIIYNIILRFIWSPKGLQMIIDELLHSVIPVLFLVYWLIFVLKNQLKWQDVLPWLIYPLVYTIFILLRGAVSGFYPYPFINISELGLKNALINAIGIAIVFLIVSLLFVAIGKFVNKKHLE